MCEHLNNCLTTVLYQICIYICICFKFCIWILYNHQGSEVCEQLNNCRTVYLICTCISFKIWIEFVQPLKNLRSASIWTIAWPCSTNGRKRVDGFDSLMEVRILMMIVSYEYDADSPILTMIVFWLILSLRNWANHLAQPISVIAMWRVSKSERRLNLCSSNVI